VFWLAQRGSAELPLLRELYREEKDADAKGRLLFAASRTGAEAKPFLLEVARDRAEPLEARKQAVFWLSKSEGVATADLASLYGTTDDRELRTHLLFVLSQRKDAAAIDKLVAVAKQDPDAELRKSALFWLGQTRDPRAAQVLQEILDQ
jgi:HEAT repeat protein